jgi:hypothetical protein
MKRTAYVCEDCYLYISMSSESSGVQIDIGKKWDPVGKRELMPMRVKNKKRISEEYE